jgi:hypothetical protein
MSCWTKCNHQRSMEYSTKHRRQKREKIQALSLAKECYSMKLELLTNATVVDDAIRFVYLEIQRELKSPSYSGSDKMRENQMSLTTKSSRKKEKNTKLQRCQLR